VFLALTGGCATIASRKGIKKAFITIIMKAYAFVSCLISKYTAGMT
jgi:hypothetical protein